MQYCRTRLQDAGLLRTTRVANLHCSVFIADNSRQSGTIGNADGSLQSCDTRISMSQDELPSARPDCRFLAGTVDLPPILTLSRRASLPTAKFEGSVRQPCLFLLRHLQDSRRTSSEHATGIHKGPGVRRPRAYGTHRASSRTDKGRSALCQEDTPSAPRHGWSFLAGRCASTGKKNTQKEKALIAHVSHCKGFATPLHVILARVQGFLRSMVLTGSCVCFVFVA